MNDYTHLGVRGYTNEHAYNRERFRVIKYYCKEEREREREKERNQTVVFLYLYRDEKARAHIKYNFDRAFSTYTDNADAGGTLEISQKKTGSALIISSRVNLIKENPN